MKQVLPFLLAVGAWLIAATDIAAQELPLKPRPDAFAPTEEAAASKAIIMASTTDEMADWDRYPTYGTYIAMMEGWATQYASLCRLDTIGQSVQGRLLLSIVIDVPGTAKGSRRQFFYTSTMHGDELTGYVMMLRLIDTLLKGYGTNEQYTDLLDNVEVYINPLANPDGTYAGGDQTVSSSKRYNANNVDLNRNFPDPFGSAPVNTQQAEVTAMIDYATAHHFLMSANLHGGSEVMNYPWDSFTSAQNPHPKSDWWQAVCKRFVDTSRTYSAYHFMDVNSQGYIAGGDWYVIPNGRQDYMNYYHDCLELTMELSSIKRLDCAQLPEYWRFLQHSLVNYIAEVEELEWNGEGVATAAPAASLTVYPNPARDRVFLSVAPREAVLLYDMHGRCVMRQEAGTQLITLDALPRGVYLLRSGNLTAKIVRQ
ncbi:MAG: DUF2817 domain-containing protein [Bacteroidales bacterium]|nr:DUF2817 domain-containing protein [Bacteroidales bacterium]